MSKRHLLALSLLAAPLLTLVHCAASGSSAAKGSIYRIAVSGAN